MQTRVKSASPDAHPTNSCEQVIAVRKGLYAQAAMKKERGTPHAHSTVGARKRTEDAGLGRKSAIAHSSGAARRQVTQRSDSHCPVRRLTKAHDLQSSSRSFPMCSGRLELLISLFIRRGRQFFVVLGQWQKVCSCAFSWLPPRAMSSA